MDPMGPFGGYNRRCQNERDVFCQTRQCDAVVGMGFSEVQCAVNKIGRRRWGQGPGELKGSSQIARVAKKTSAELGRPVFCS